MKRPKVGKTTPSGGGWRWAGLAAATGVALFIGTLSNPFIRDDATLILRNPLVQQPGRALEVFTTGYWAPFYLLGEAHDLLYRPLTIFSFVLNHAAGGNAPEGYRAVNLFLHALTSVGVFWLGRRFGLGQAASGAAAVLFAAHPIHTEVVNDMVGRADLMATVGVLGGMALLLGGALPGMAPIPSSPGRGGAKAVPPRAPAETPRVPVLGASTLFLLALMAKEVGAALLGWAVLWWAWCRWGREKGGAPAGRPFAVALSGMGGALAIYLAIRYAALGMLVRSVPPEKLANPLAHVGAGERMVGALGVLGRYFRLLVWPWPLSVDYSYAQVLPGGGATLGWVAVGTVLLLLWGWSAWRWRAESPWIAFGLVVFLAGYLPVSNLAVPIGTVMAERFLFVPSAGFLIAAVPSAGALAARWRGAGPVLLATAAVAFAGMTWLRNQDWSDGLLLWRRAAEVSPWSAQALRNYGQHLYLRGQPEESLGYLKRSADIYPGHFPVWLDLGNAQVRLGRFSEAEASFQRGLQVRPNAAPLHLGLAGLYEKMALPDKALFHLERVVNLDPGSGLARVALGNLYVKVDKPGLAADQYEAALRIVPGRGEIHHNLAIALFMTGRRPEGLAHAREAERLGIKLLPGLVEELRKADGR